MWEEKNKNGLYLNSKFRINNLDYLYLGKSDSKECFSAIKIILRLGKKYNYYSIEKIIILFEETSQCIDSFIDKLKAENKKFGQLAKFNAEIKKNDFKRSCDFASGALKEIIELNSIYNSKDDRIGSYVIDDYSHIIASSSFRRLQDKAQVYSLESRDFARSRLTHSNEVSSNCELISSYINYLDLYKNYKINPQNNSFNEDIMLIVRCAGLLHDIGNPPFGHFGEKVIRDFFSREYKNEFTKRGIFENSQFYKDFIKFDGNAQALRIATKLQYFGRKKGLCLTSSVLGSIIKYPFDSTYGEHKKMGYFYSERKIINKLSICGVYKEYIRNPLALILEAADDISYLTADLEDAIHKGIIGIDDFIKYEDKNDSKVFDLINKIEKYYNDNIEIYKYFLNSKSIFEKTMRSIIADIRHDLIEDAANTFINNKNQIFTEGVFFGPEKNNKFEILKNLNEYGPIVNMIENIMKKVFKDETVIMSEIKGYEILKYLLNRFCEAVKDSTLDFVKRVLKSDNNYYQHLLSLISKDFISNFFDELDDEGVQNDNINVQNDNIIFYYKMRLVVDFISGMTDNFAKDLYNSMIGK